MEFNSPSLAERDTKTRQSNAPPDSHTEERGFTLTELVALLAATGFLLVLISTSMAGSEDQSSRTRCFSNLRQLGQAMLMYSTDNSDYMAWPNWGNQLGKQGWLYTPSSSMQPPSSSLAGYESGAWFAYVRNTNSYMCPESRKSRYFRLRDNKLSSYVMNGAVAGYGTSSRNPKPTCKIYDPWSPNCYLLWEPDEYLTRVGAFAFNDASSYPDAQEGVGRIHSPTLAFVLSVSGDVRSTPFVEIDAEKKSSTRSLAWWSPFGGNGR